MALEFSEKVWKDFSKSFHRVRVRYDFKKYVQIQPSPTGFALVKTHASHEFLATACVDFASHAEI